MKRLSLLSVQLGALGSRVNGAGPELHPLACLDDRRQKLANEIQQLLNLATLRPHRVRRMVIVAATPYYPAQARRLMAAMTEETRSPSEWAEMRGRHVHGDAQIRDLWRIGRGFADSYDDMNFTRPLLSTIVAPTLVVNGDHDPLYPADLSLELFQTIPVARLWIIPNGGHGPIFGEHREAFARTALAFVHEC